MKRDFIRLRRERIRMFSPEVQHLLALGKGKVAHLTTVAVIRFPHKTKKDQQNGLKGIPCKRAADFYMYLSTQKCDYWYTTISPSFSELSLRWREAVDKDYLP